MNVRVRLFFVDKSTAHSLSSKPRGLDSQLPILQVLIKIKDGTGWFDDEFLS